MIANSGHRSLFFITVAVPILFLFTCNRHVQALFDGKTLNGWHALPGGKWEVENGVLKGTSPASETRHGLLVSNDIFKDFELSLQFKSVKGNSGLYFRVKEVGGAYGVEGFQAEIHPTEAVGGLYETAGRGWVVEPDSAIVKKWNKPGDWNTMTVKAVGQSVTVHVNGFKTAELQNDPGRTEGHIALQLHGDQDMEVYFKDIKIKNL